MPVELFDFRVLRWRLPLMHARQLDDIAYEKVVDPTAIYDDFIATCQVVYRGAARTAELTRYLVLLVMFSRAAAEPVVGRQAKMEALFQWATGEAPTTKGKAGRLGAALRVSHFLLCNGKYMDACVLHRFFSLNSVIDCPKALLVDDSRLARLLERLSTGRHDTAQVLALARRVLQEGEVDEVEVGEQRQAHARDPAVVQPQLQSIKAIKEDGTYLAQLSQRSRCVSLTEEAITAIKGGTAMLAAFSRTRQASTLLVPRRPSRSEPTVVEVCGQRSKHHQALLEGNTSRRWYPTAQLLLWKDGRVKVDEYQALHSVTIEPAAPSIPREQAHYIDQVSKEPLTDPYTLEHDSHRESYNLTSWQSLLSVRHTSSPVLKAPIEFYRADGRTVFLPQPDPNLEAEVARWLLTPAGQAYATEVDVPAHGGLDEAVCPAVATSNEINSVALDLSPLPTVIQAGVRAEANDAVSDDVEGHSGDRLVSSAAVGTAGGDASADRRADDTETAGLRRSSSADSTISTNALPNTTSQLTIHDRYHDICSGGSQLLHPSTAGIIDSLPAPQPVEMPSLHGDELRLEVEALRAELERVKQQSKTVSRLSPSTTGDPRRRPAVRSIQPNVERAALLAELRGAPMMDVATDFLNDNFIAYGMEVLNHHNHLLHHQDQHAYCFDPQLVARAAVADGYGLRALDIAAAEAARYWLLPCNTTGWHWWLDVYDKFRHVLYRADSMSKTQTNVSLLDLPTLNLWPDDPPEVRHLTVPQQEDGVSCGDHVLQFALVIATPGWYPDSDTLSRVLPWDRGQELRRLRAGRWEVERPQLRLAAIELSRGSMGVDVVQLSEKPLRRSHRKRGWDEVGGGVVCGQAVA